MSDEMWSNPSELRGGGQWFKSSEYEGRIVMFAGFKPAGHDQWGNAYAKGTILIPDAENGPVVYTPGTGGELKGNLMVTALAGNAIGRLEKGEAKAGMNAPWILQDLADGPEKEAAKATWVKLLELRQGEWLPPVDPDEAPF